MKLFLSYLAVERKISASTLFRNVIAVPVQGLECVVRARSGKRLPVVLSIGEVRQVLSKLQGTDRLMATIIYGAGLRLEESCR